MFKAKLSMPAIDLDDCVNGESIRKFGSVSVYFWQWDKHVSVVNTPDSECVSLEQVDHNTEDGEHTTSLEQMNHESLR